MNKKHVPVTDMTFGQLYDAVASGEEFYFSDSAKLKIYRGCVEPASNGDQEDVILKLKKGEITRLVETPWTDQLDGTWKNGVWCKCDNREFIKVVRFTAIRDFIGSNSVVYNEAIPLPQDLANQLETLSKEQSK